MVNEVGEALGTDDYSGGQYGKKEDDGRRACQDSSNYLGYPRVGFHF